MTPHRVPAGDVQRGDRIAQKREGPYRTVMDTTASRNGSVRIDYATGLFDRPMSTRKLWRQPS